VYIDSWQPPADIHHTLSMHSGDETHPAILSDVSMDQRHWNGDATIAALTVRVEFLLLDSI
jgi:hypothetical protein